jgi:transposase InsO family protein
VLEHLLILSFFMEGGVALHEGLMRERGLFACRRRHRTITTKSEPGARVSPNVLDQEFTATRPNEKWTGDARPYGAFCSVLKRTTDREVPYDQRANRRGKPHMGPEHARKASELKVS